MAIPYSPASSRTDALQVETMFMWLMVATLMIGCSYGLHTALVILGATVQKAMGF
jgi:hypothetical protein